MADFSTWQRATLEQFAREATEKLVADRAAIDELLAALEYYKDAVCAGEESGGGYYSIGDDGHVARAAITKHTQRKEQ